MFRLFYMGLRRIKKNINNVFCYITTYFHFVGNGVRFSTFKTRGVPYVIVARDGGVLSIGRDFKMNNGDKGNPIGCYERCTLFVDRESELIIGDNVGISQTALISHCSIRIGKNVKIGGGTSIYTTDFHSLNPVVRSSDNDMKDRKTSPVIIGDNVFIGAKCIILKGVSIGENAVVGAGSVVTKDIPADEKWAGNPARFIGRI